MNQLAWRGASQLLVLDITVHAARYWCIGSMYNVASIFCYMLDAT